MKNGLHIALVSVAVAAFFLVGGTVAAERPDAARDLASLQRQLPAGLFPAVVRALQGERADAYRVSRAPASDAVAYRARNAAHGMAVAFAPEGVRVSLLGGADWTWGLALSGYGRDDVMRPVFQGRLQASGNRVEYAYAEGVTAWYVNGPLGLQQGFTLARRPVGGAGELEVRLDLSGAVSAEVSADGRSALLRQVGGGESRRYSGLYVYDAGGRELSARLSSGPGGLSIRVDDRGAQYPIVIDPVIEDAKLTPSDGAAHDNAGYSVSVSGDTIVVGAYRDDDSGSASGSAYVFEKSSGGWMEVAKLTASDAAAHDEFGVSVSVSGATVVVGARLDDDNGLSSGSAYVFEKPVGGWMDATEVAKLTASDAAAHDWFGWSVSVSGDTIVVGAYGEDDNGYFSGSAYVFEKPSGGWMDATQTAKLTASDGVAWDYFGYSVSVSGATVVVGAYGNDGNGSNSGSAYVFERPSGGWANATQTAKLTASDGAADDVFGVSVSVSGDTVVVGANWDDDNGSASGSAYVFEKPVGGWTDATETAKLTASDASASDHFGVSVSVSGDTVVVGAHWDNDKGINSGSAYVFEKPVGGWMDVAETAKLTASDGTPDDYFGYSVSVSGATVVVGAGWDDDNGYNSGSAYVFERPVGGWVDAAHTKLTPSDGAADDGFGYSLSVSGATVVVGAPWNDDNGSDSGSVYVFERSSEGWWDTTETAKLTASDRAPGDHFGVSVSVSGATVVVGAHGDDTWYGAAYVFEKSNGGWTETAKLTASDAVSYDFFGTSVSVSGDTVAVGAFGDGSNSGSAYVFEKPVGGWMDATETAKLMASDATAVHYFGHSVSVSGATIVVGAYGDDSGSGAAYVFEKPVWGWTETAKLTASDRAPGDVFGASVSVSGDTVVIGAHGDGSDSGSAYVFERPSGGWMDATETAKLTASDGWTDDQFGISVSVSGDTIVVGADGDDDDSGSAYEFEKPDGGWMDATETAKLAASDGSADDRFGLSVSVSGATVVVGVPADDSGTASGSAYVFTPPLVLRQHPHSNAGGWEITETGPVEVSFIGWSKNDQVSCLIVGDGYTVELFKHGGFGGTRLIYYGPQTIDAAELSQHGMNNQISSYKLYVTP